MNKENKTVLAITILLILFVAVLLTCNDDGGGKYVTAVFFRRIM